MVDEYVLDEKWLMDVDGESDQTWISPGEHLPLSRMFEEPHDVFWTTKLRCSFSFFLHMACFMCFVCFSWCLGLQKPRLDFATDGSLLKPPRSDKFLAFPPGLWWKLSMVRRWDFLSVLTVLIWYFSCRSPRVKSWKPWCAFQQNNLEQEQTSRRQVEVTMTLLAIKRRSLFGGLSGCMRTWDLVIQAANWCHVNSWQHATSVCSLKKDYSFV